MKQKVLVTGAAGFIGSHLVKRLLTKDFIVIGLDNFSNGNIENVYPFLSDENFTFFEGDIRNIGFLNDIITDIDYVFHEAALIEIEESIKNPVLYNSVNVNGTLNILWSSYKNDVKKVIFASTAAVYGESKSLPTPETAKLKPNSIYGLSKKVSEEYCHLFNKLYGLNFTILRYFNAYGPGQDPTLPYTGVITKFLSQILSGNNIKIYGNGEQTRDFIYIEDLIIANLLAASNSDANNDIFNIASGNYISLNELSQLILDICVDENIKEVTVEHTEEKKSEVKNHQADISHAKKILKYNPQYSLIEGIKKTLKWLKNPHSQNIHKRI